jgi:OOP family OmpA-OmpF porin
MAGAAQLPSAVVDHIVEHGGSRHMEPVDIRKKFLAATCAICALSLSACAGTKDVGEAAALKPSGPAFTQSLHKDYVALAQSELEQGDRTSARHYAMKAKEAAAGKTVGPDAVATRQIGAPQDKTLSDARARLVAALGSAEAGKKPAEAAKAQSNFDCWMEQQEEGWQLDHIAACRKGFDTAMAALAPEKMAAKSPELQTVYFKFNSTELTAKSEDELAAIIRDVKLAKPKTVQVISYTDLAGDKAYNAKLAAMRGKSIEEKLKDAGAPIVRVDARGPVEPVVDTAKPNQENRRAVIIFQ